MVATRNPVSDSDFRAKGHGVSRPRLSHLLCQYLIEIPKVSFIIFPPWLLTLPTPRPSLCDRGCVPATWRRGIFPQVPQSSKLSTDRAQQHDTYDGSLHGHSASRAARRCDRLLCPRGPVSRRRCVVPFALDSGPLTRGGCVGRGEIATRGTRRSNGQTEILHG